MTITIICITGLLVTSFVGWKIGQAATITATEILHLPVSGFQKLLPLTAALALAGGLTVGAWQATERLSPTVDRVDEAKCTQLTSCSPCNACPSAE